MSTEGLLGGGRATSRDGTEIGYLTLGPQQGGEPARGQPTVLCTHGAYSSGADWLPVARLLADRFRLVLMDRRAHGCSGGARDAVHGEVALRQEREDLLAVLADATAPGDPVALVGHSTGACTALAACLEPDGPRFERIAVLEPPLVQDVTEADVARFHRLLAAGAYEQAVVWGFRDVQRLAPKGVDRMRRNPRNWAEIVAGAPMMVRHWEMALVWAAPDRFAALRTPTLVMCGTRSEERPFRMSSQELAAALPDVRWDEIDGHHHVSMLRDPEPVAARIRKFLDEEAP